MTIDDFDRAVPIHWVVPTICPCGQPAQRADDHTCGECAEHCTLEAHRRREAERRLAEQARYDAELHEIHAQRAAVRRAA